MGRRSRERSRPPARRTGTRTPKRRILVLCEGRVTEPEYLNGFKRSCRNPLVHVEIPRDHGTPRTLVEAARERKNEALDAARREKDDNISFDEVWCVFDVDEHPKLAEAENMARDNGIELAISNPCFELWLLLHFQESPGARHRSELPIMLRGHVAGFDKHLRFDDYAPGYEIACERAERVQRLADEDGEPHRNPTTGVFRLTRSIARTEL